METSSRVRQKNKCPVKVGSSINSSQKLRETFLVQLGNGSGELINFSAELCPGFFLKAFQGSQVCVFQGNEALPPEILGLRTGEEYMAAGQSQQGAAIFVERGSQNRREEWVITAASTHHRSSPHHEASEGQVLSPPWPDKGAVAHRDEGT